VAKMEEILSHIWPFSIIRADIVIWGYPKQIWQDQELLQDQEERMLMDLNRSSQDDDDDSNVKNANWDNSVHFCMHVRFGIHSFIPESILRQVCNLFQSAFFTEYDLVLPLLISSIP
jgi:hypothetical protein